MKPLLAPPPESPTGLSGDALTPDYPIRGDATLAYYEDNASSYSSATLSLDMDPWLSRFERLLPKGAAILDAGCGSGRDLASFRAAGFDALGLDLSRKLAAVAREFSGCRVLVGDLREPPFDAGSFDGIWAAASLLHLTRAEVAPALERLRRLLRPSGIMFASVKRGTGAERGHDGRLFTYFQPEEWRKLLAASGFAAIEIEANTSGSGWIQSFARTG